MTWWMTLLIILFSVILIMVVMILIVRFNKKIDAEASIGDNSVAVKIENDKPNDLTKPITEIDKLNSYNEIQYEFIKNYVISIIESHALITTVFCAIEYNEDIVDKIFLKLLKKNGYENTKDLNIDIAIIHKFFKEYVSKIHEYIDKYILEIKNELDDINKLSANVDKLCKLFETDTFVSGTIQEFKNRGFKTDLMNGEIYSITSESFNDALLQKYKLKIKKSSVELVSELKLAKTQLLATDNKIIKVLSAMRCINLIFDAIIKHIHFIYFESKPAVIGDSKGV